MLLCLAAAGLLLGEARADQARVDIGFLTCSVVQGGHAKSESGALPEEGRELLCTFTPTASGPEETYIGTFQSVGSDQEPWAGRTMVWVVKGRSPADMAPGLLQQVYAADATASPRHAPPLVGQANGSIVLLDIADARQLGASPDKQGEPAPAVVLLALSLKSAST